MLNNELRYDLKNIQLGITQTALKVEYVNNKLKAEALRQVNDLFFEQGKTWLDYLHFIRKMIKIQMIKSMSEGKNTTLCLDDIHEIVKDAEKNIKNGIIDCTFDAAFFRDRDLFYEGVTSEGNKIINSLATDDIFDRCANNHTTSEENICVVDELNTVFRSAWHFMESVDNVKITMVTQSMRTVERTVKCLTNLTKKIHEDGDKIKSNITKCLEGPTDV
ncbi:PREDICTED: uncharacterized protein LOC106744853 [Dinoponera quadriceps]|uniref:Uncharacterized protein LOC106744853 n=1 Tax=Dinoponera quadriceps TaxID=609295 RepID=A0A6P3XAY6_DINQU|nr:PREDICTED: uncharacterized protein LOC106744853 [Dinoponera quadriceps]